MRGTMIDHTTHSADFSDLPLRLHWQQALAAINRRQLPTRVDLHRWSGAATGRGIPSCVPATRLLLCTHARACYRLATPTGAEELVLNEGEAVLIAPDAGVANVSREPYESVGFIFYPDSVRVYGILHEPTGTARFPDPLRLLRHNYVHPVPLDEDGRRLLACALGATAFGPESAYRHHLVAALLLQVEALLARPTAGVTRKAARTFRSLVRHVEVHLGEALTRERLATALRLHPNHVSRLFREFSGQTFLAFLRAIRLDRAEALLHQGTHTVAEIASACGFGSSSSLIRAFQQRHGVSPGRWNAPFPPDPTPVDRTGTTCGLGEKWRL